MKIKLKYTTTLILFLLQSHCIISQIKLTNPGFEDTPADATVPKTWLPCESGTTPDILPGFWGEYGEAQQGETYVGLITRSDGSFEAIGQKLSSSLIKGECYTIKLYLAKGSTYAGFNKPLKLRVWLGNEICDKGQTIFTTKEVNHSDWKPYIIEFTPKDNYQYFRIEAFYQDGEFSYKGNILIDNLSNIIKCTRV
jgi:hypothetical protein